MNDFLFRKLEGIARSQPPLVVLGKHVERYMDPIRVEYIGDLYLLNHMQESLLEKRNNLFVADPFTFDNERGLLLKVLASAGPNDDPSYESLPVSEYLEAYKRHFPANFKFTPETALEYALERQGFRGEDVAKGRVQSHLSLYIREYTPSYLAAKASGFAGELPSDTSIGDLLFVLAVKKPHLRELALRIYRKILNNSRLLPGKRVPNISPVVWLDYLHNGETSLGNTEEASSEPETPALENYFLTPGFNEKDPLPPTTPASDLHTLSQVASILNRGGQERLDLLEVIRAISGVPIEVESIKENWNE